MSLWHVPNRKYGPEHLSKRRGTHRRKPLSVLAALIAVVFMGVGLPAASALHQPGSVPAPTSPDPAAPSPDPQADLRWGERTAAAERDCDGDGVIDVLVATPFEDVGANLNEGKVRLVSGASLVPNASGTNTPVVIHTFNHPEPQLGAKFGFFIVVLDHDPDKSNVEPSPAPHEAMQPYVAIGTDAQDQTVGSTLYVDSGAAYVFEVCTGALKGSLYNPYPQGSPTFGRATGNTPGDAVVCSPSGVTGDTRTPPSQGECKYSSDPQPREAPGNRARFGSRLGYAGDVLPYLPSAPDGKADLIVGASGNDWMAESAGGPSGCGQQPPGVLIPGCRFDQGQAFVYDIGNMSLERRIELPPGESLSAAELANTMPPPESCGASCGSFGIAVQGPGDTNSSPRTFDSDHLVNSTNAGPGTTNASAGKMYLFEGGSAVTPTFGGPCPPALAGPNPPCEQERYRIENPEPAPLSFFGFQDAAPLSPGDVGSAITSVTLGGPDNNADLYGNGFLQTPLVPPGLPAEGQAWVFDGLSGTPLYKIKDPTPTAGGQFGWSMTKNVPNHLRGKPQDTHLYIGASPHFVPGTDQNGGTSLHLKQNGLWDATHATTELPPQCRQLNGTLSNVGPNLGWTVSAPGDLDGDIGMDYVAGAPFMDRGLTRRNEGLVFSFTSSGLPTGLPVCPPGGPQEQAISVP